MSLFELIMLVCFGFSWPIAIYKSLKSRKTGGKSFYFNLVVALGYVSGVIHKLLYSMDFVTFLYMLNLVMVLIDTALYFRNVKIEKEVAAMSQPIIEEMAQMMKDKSEIE